MNQLLFGFNMSMLVWMFGTFMMFTFRGNENAGVFWDRFIYGGVVFMPPLMHHFSLLFTKRQGQQRKLLIANYIMAFLSLAASRTPYFVDGLNYFWWGVHSQARVLHHVFLGYFFLGTGLFFYNIWRYYRKLNDHTSRVQAVFVFFAFAIVIFIGGSAYLYAYNIDTRLPFAYITGIIFPVMLFYAVSRHNLLGVKVIGTEVLVGVGEFLIVMEIFFSKTATEVLIRVGFALILSVIGALLIKSVRKEIIRNDELAQLAKSLEKANIRLQELDRQKTDFLSIAAHQLRTPLSIINGYIELIKDGGYGKVGKKMRDTLDNMDDSNTRLTKLVDEFLDITRIEQGRTKFTFKESNIADVITSAVEELRDRGEQKGIKIKWTPPKKPITPSFDDEKVRHVIFNFIDNAIKYSTKGLITVGLAQDEVGVAVTVNDNGLGFNKIDEVNFFQKFYRGENVKGINVTGTGLGLYVCRKFIETHGGRIWAHSAGLGEGSEFGFWIPMVHKVDPVKDGEDVAKEPISSATFNA
jgi:signal transduction histidine kinase